jgi:hypothetical protein
MIPARITLINKFGFTQTIYGSYLRHGRYVTIFRFDKSPLVKEKKKVVKVELINLNRPIKD